MPPLMECPAEEKPCPIELLTWATGAVPLCHHPVPADEVCTLVVTKPVCSARLESCPKFRMLPREIPNPAELLAMFTLLPACTGIGPRCIGKILCPGRRGGRGRTNPTGALRITGNEFNGMQAPPGCHAH